tara:strand:+ start:15556 stop:15705 length:150 start_codon:yes stop_codon:yes gene_type:complete
MFDDEDESIFDMLKGHFKEVLGLLMFIVIITIWSNFDTIGQWIESFFAR